MKPLLKIVHELGLAARLFQRVLLRRLRGQIDPEPDRQVFTNQCQTWLTQAASNTLAHQQLVDVPADQPPWLDTGIDLQADQAVTLLSCGRVYLSRALDIWVNPHFQLWMRVGTDGEVFSGTRDTHTFTATTTGRLYLASYFPGEWGTQTGELGTDPAEYAKITGGITTLVMGWQPETEPAQALAALIDANAPPQAQAEIERLASSNNTPKNWNYLWFLGKSEIYQAKVNSDADPAPSIACHTHADVGILQHAAAMELTPDTELSWQWRVDRLPSDLAEDTLPTHDYLSIAVEFDNGLDLSWYWSAELPVETIFTCPLPTWAHRETHMVIRSGQQGLGEWQQEKRNVYEDCVRALGAPAANITRVWLIANSLFQRQPGTCEYRNIRLQSAAQTIAID